MPNRGALGRPAVRAGTPAEAPEGGAARGAIGRAKDWEGAGGVGEEYIYRHVIDIDIDIYIYIYVYLYIHIYIYI